MALNDVIYNKKVDVAQAMPVPVVFAKQNDNAKRKVVVMLVKNGQPFVLGTGVNGYIQGATAPNPVTKRQIKFKRDLTAIDTTQGTATFIITESMTAEIGITQCEVSIYDTEKPQEILCTANINIEVQGTGMSLNDEMASDDYQAIVSIKAEVTAMRDEVRDKTNQAIAAKSAAETAAQNAYNSALGVQKIVAGNEAYTKQEADLKYSVAPRKVQTSTTGELKLTDADYGLSYIELQGNSEQYTNTGNKNLIDLEYQKLHGINENRYLDVNGEITAPSVDKDWKISYYIKVKPSTVYIFTNLPASFVTTVGFYTKDKTFISGINNSQIVVDGGIITTPSNCEYIRVSFRAGTENTLQLEEGNVATAYIKGAVDTPSPEYPSEVKSVGDIPKDSNGVEIRNVFNNNTLFFDMPQFKYVELGEFEAGVRFIMYKMPDNPITGLYVRLSGDASKWVADPGDSQIIAKSKYALTTGTQYSYEPQTGKKVYLKVTYAIDSEPPRLPTKEELKSLLDTMIFMVTPAENIDEYRPYIGENNGLVKMESASKNLFNPQVIYNMKPTAVVVSGDTVIIDNVSGFVNQKLLSGKFKENTQYTLSVYSKRILDSTSIGDGNFRFRAVFTDGTGQDLGILNYNNYTYVKATTIANKTIDYITVNYNQPEIKIWLKELQLEEGIQATEYRPYKEQITWIPLREPLRGLPDGRVDTIDRDGNVIQYIARSGIEQYPIAQESDQMFEGNLFRTTFKGGSYVGLAKKDNGVYCNIMKFKQTASLQYGVSASPLYGVIYFNLKGKLSENTVDLARKFLNDNNAVFYFTLRTPITYQIPAIYIETYEPVTNVRCLNKVKPSTMGLDYKLAISSLIKRLEALETTAVQEVTRNV